MIYNGGLISRKKLITLQKKRLITYAEHVSAHWAEIDFHMCL